MSHDNDEGAGYERELERAQIALIAMQMAAIKSGQRTIVIFEGRDGAGKDGSIKRLTEHLSQRATRVVALPKPSDRERSQWYFQRYAAHLPAAGELVIFNRSWYNRAGVEPVMGFCTPEQTDAFLDEAPRFERMLTRDGIHLFKFWLAIGREMQLKRFHSRRHDPLKQWKISDIDIAALGKWDSYTDAAHRMLKATHSDETPWHVVLANDKQRARLELIRCLLESIDYEGRDEKALGEVDEKIVIDPDRFIKNHSES